MDRTNIDLRKRLNCSMSSLCALGSFGLVGPMFARGLSTCSCTHIFVGAFRVSGRSDECIGSVWLLWARAHLAMIWSELELHCFVRAIMTVVPVPVPVPVPPADVGTDRFHVYR